MRVGTSCEKIIKQNIMYHSNLQTQIIAIRIIDN